MPTLQPASPPNTSKVDHSAKTIVIVDAAIQNYQYLLASPLSGLEVSLLTDQADGLAQIKALLRPSQAWSAIHLICNGEPGQLQIGSTCLREDNLWAYADEFRQWRSYLTHTTEIMIYGCQLTTNRAGQALVSWLNLLTGAKVKALS